MANKEIEKGQRRVLAVLHDYKKTFSTPHGKRVLRRMMKECGVQRPSFIEGDPHSTAFNEGRRSVVIEICDRLKYDLRRLESEMTRKDDDYEDDYID